MTCRHVVLKTFSWPSDKGVPPFTNVNACEKCFSVYVKVYVHAEDAWEDALAMAESQGKASDVATLRGYLEGAKK